MQSRVYAYLLIGQSSRHQSQGGHVPGPGVPGPGQVSPPPSRGASHHHLHPSHHPRLPANFQLTYSHDLTDTWHSLSSQEDALSIGEQSFTGLQVRSLQILKVIRRLKAAKSENPILTKFCINTVISCGASNILPFDIVVSNLVALENSVRSQNDDEMLV